MVLNSLRYFHSFNTYMSQTQCRLPSDAFLQSVRKAFNTESSIASINIKKLINKNK